ncbi:hypothetical protein [Micromonospora sp. NPDC003241]
MAKKMLGKVVAGAALGGASLLVFAPGVALADGHGPEDEGKVFAKPHAVKPGDEVKLVQICEEAQEHPFVWSKVTGKVELESAHKDGDKGDKGDKGGDRDWKQDRKDWEDRKDSQDGKDWESGGEDRSGGKDWSGETGSAPESKGTGGGAADAADESGKDRDWKAEEHGQDAEGARDHKAPSAEEERGAKSEKDWSSKSEHESSGEKDWASEGEREWERSSERDWSGEHGKDSGEHGKDDSGDRWEHEKDFVYYGEARVAKDAKPGTYELKGSCGVGELVVLPRGGVDGGDGGIATGANGGLATAGAGMVGAAALGGLVLMRRRRTDEFAA